MITNLVKDKRNWKILALASAGLGISMIIGEGFKDLFSGMGAVVLSSSILITGIATGKISRNIVTNKPKHLKKEISNNIRKDIRKNVKIREYTENQNHEPDLSNIINENQYDNQLISSDDNFANIASEARKYPTRPDIKSSLSLDRDKQIGHRY